MDISIVVGRPAVERANGDKEWWVNGQQHRECGRPAVELANGDKEWVNGNLHREGGLPAIEDVVDGNEWYIYNRELSEEQGLVYFAFCKKIQEKKLIRAQKKIYFWWIQICYDLEHKSGCGQRMAQKNLEVFETMMKI